MTTTPDTIHPARSAIKLGCLSAAFLAAFVASSPAANAHIIPDGPHANSSTGSCWHKPVLPPWCQ